MRGAAKLPTRASDGRCHTARQKSDSKFTWFPDSRNSRYMAQWLLCSPLGGCFTALGRPGDPKGCGANEPRTPRTKPFSQPCPAVPVRRVHATLALKCRCKSIQSDGGPMQGLKGKCAKSATSRDLRIGAAKKVRCVDAGTIQENPGFGVSVRVEP